MDRIIDQAWASLLASVMKKREVLRPELGDDIDLYLPQSRLLSLVESLPDLRKHIYSSAQVAAKRNANTIVKKLGMPADYFWKFEYWPRARALTNLGQIVRRVFSSMLDQAKEGNLEITELDVDPLRITVNFTNCAECAGISELESAVCYYHAGTFSGIISGLINRDLDGFETECCATGNESCCFITGDRDDGQIETSLDAYLSPPAISTDLTSRLEKSLHKDSVRTIGNLVDINYYRLAVASTLLADPERFTSTNFEVGSQLGHKLASVLAGFYGHEGLQNMSDYYSQLGGFGVDVKGDEVQLELEIKECAEAVGPVKLMEMTSFLLGELQGLTSELTGKEVVLKENRFEGEKLFITYIPKT